MVEARMVVKSGFGVGGMHLSPIVCRWRACAARRGVRGRHVLAGASERARSVREHDKARMSGAEREPGPEDGAEL